MNDPEISGSKKKLFARNKPHVHVPHVYIGVWVVCTNVEKYILLETDWNFVLPRIQIAWGSFLNGFSSPQEKFVPSQVGAYKGIDSAWAQSFCLAFIKKLTCGQ
jgi:hypothetical protein